MPILAGIAQTPEVYRCWYFLSYARGDQNNPSPDRDLVRRFHLALLDALVSNPDGLDAMGFRDREDIDLGETWRDVLLAALRGCRTFIPLMSQNYFSREACGQEWAAFESRADNNQLILPLIWTRRPGEEKRYPAFVAELNDDFAQAGRTDEDAKKLSEYRTYGLRRVLQDAPNDSRQQAVLNAVVDTVANKIWERAAAQPLQPAAAHQLLVLPAPKFGGAPQPAALAPAPAARCIHVGIAAGTSTEMAVRRKDARTFYPSNADRDWRLFAPREATTVSEFALRAAEVHNVDCAWLDLRSRNGTTPGLVQRIRDLEAPAGEQPVLLLIDPWSVDIPEFTAALASVDEQRFKNCAVVVIWNFAESKDGSVAADDNRRRALQATVRQLFRRSYPSNVEEASRDFIANITQPAAFRDLLVNLVRDLLQLSAAGRTPMRPVPPGSPLQCVQAQ